MSCINLKSSHKVSKILLKGVFLQKLYLILFNDYLFIELLLIYISNLESFLQKKKNLESKAFTSI